MPARSAAVVGSGLVETELRHEAPEGESRFIYVISGSVVTGPDREPAELGPGDAAGLAQQGSELVVQAPEGEAHIIVVGGRPRGEPERDRWYVDDLAREYMLKARSGGAR
jgi:redox-sensitive bicupin YhaK (pirin superfamily)